jgi:adenylosuccinate lyase
MGSPWSLSPLDGRYAEQVAELAPLVSEHGFNRYRLQVEAHWLLQLSDEASFKSDLSLPLSVRDQLVSLANGQIDDGVLERVKEIESKTRHDVKACEYALQEILKASGASERVLAFLHFACTSEDINNLSYALMQRDVVTKHLRPKLLRVLDALRSIAERERETPMLSRTHGQPATPTSLGKEMAVFHWRLQRQVHRLDALQYLGKINGAVGCFNAHVVACPDVDWLKVSREFVEKRLGLTWNPLTTQIESHDSFVEVCRVIQHVNTIMIDLARDVWGYISYGYFVQKAVAGEIGSSTMPHKVNPIQFENAEGNLGIANALFEHFAAKLPVSRFQRDLSDSTVLRSFGSAVGHTSLAWTSLQSGFERVGVDRSRIMADLQNSWELLGEAVQTVLRRRGCSDAYERLKDATRGQAVVSKDVIHEVIAKSPELTPKDREYLLGLTPLTYTGLAGRLVDLMAGF